jgi:MoxR-like ATPase
MTAGTAHPGSEQRQAELARLRWLLLLSDTAAIGLAMTARAAALLQGKPNAGFDEVRRVARSVLGHRLILDYAARLEGWDSLKLVERLLAIVPEVPGTLPEDLQA